MREKANGKCHVLMEQSSNAGNREDTVWWYDSWDEVSLYRYYQGVGVVDTSCIRWERHETFTAHLTLWRSSMILAILDA